MTSSGLGSTTQMSLACAPSLKRQYVVTRCVMTCSAFRSRRSRGLRHYPGQSILTGLVLGQYLQPQKRDACVMARRGRNGHEVILFATLYSSFVHCSLPQRERPASCPGHWAGATANSTTSPARSVGSPQGSAPALGYSNSDTDVLDVISYETFETAH